MKLRFTKMQGLGNDFIVFDAINQTLQLNSRQIRAMADRHFGIGCDQVLLVEPPTRPSEDFRYRIFNADGNEVEQCGNGARCFARFVHDQGLTDKSDIRVETAAGPIHLFIESDGKVRVAMGRPQWEPAAIPFIAPTRADRYAISAHGRTVEIGAVSMGNPHAVMRVEAVSAAPVATLGPLLERHERFPQRTNVGFMEIMDRDHIRLRVFERGVGETLACGTGACAAVAVGRIQGLLDTSVRVDLPGGDLTIRWQNENEPVIMTGPAYRVFEGWIEL
jgi:diaminopimelate epimerase